MLDNLNLLLIIKSFLIQHLKLRRHDKYLTQIRQTLHIFSNLFRRPEQIDKDLIITYIVLKIFCVFFYVFKGEQFFYFLGEDCLACFWVFFGVVV